MLTALHPPGMTTALRDQDNYGPYGIKGPYGVKGPPPPWEVQAAELKEREKVMRKFDKLRPKGGGAMTSREPRNVNYTSVAKSSWIKRFCHSITLIPNPMLTLTMNLSERSSLTPRTRRFEGHPAVNSLLPMPVHLPLMPTLS